MKALSANVTRGIPVGANVDVCDNSGAKKVRIFNVRRYKNIKGALPKGGIGDFVMGSVVSGRPDVRKKVVIGVIVRQKKEYKRADGTRIKFEDNAMIVFKDDKGNPKGTIFKGPIAKEAVERWPALAKIASIVV
ncbi:MAG: uL14 family ribosomal protein [Candidatus Nanoarchaeia archaeon]|nr:uL14 family ribosomal protein [Candidatus Nanoarchaeia archaeon]